MILTGFFQWVNSIGSFKVKVLCTIGLVLDTGLARQLSIHYSTLKVNLQVSKEKVGTLRARSGEIVEMLERTSTSTERVFKIILL